jgi:hypothetical protein
MGTRFQLNRTRWTSLSAHADKWSPIFLLPEKYFFEGEKMLGDFGEDENNPNYHRYKAHFTYKVPHMLSAMVLLCNTSLSPL